MAVRGVYSEAEKEMLAKFEETADRMSGWRQPLFIPVPPENQSGNLPWPWTPGIPYGVMPVTRPPAGGEVSSPHQATWTPTPR